MIEEAYFSVSGKINPGYLESMAILFPLRGEIIKRVQKELIQGPKFNKPRAPQGPISQLKSVKERPELQGKRKVIVAFDEEEEESPEPPLATKRSRSTSIQIREPSDQAQAISEDIREAIPSQVQQPMKCAGRKPSQIERRSNLREDEFKLRGEAEATKQEVEEQARDLAAAKAKKQWLLDQLKALQDTHGDQVGPDVFKFLEKLEIEEEEEEDEEEEEEDSEQVA